MCFKAYHLSSILTIIVPGADPTDIVFYVDIYYAPSVEDTENNTAYSKGDETIQKSYSADRQLHQQAWSWLVQHPDIRVGKNGEGNGLSLSEVERFNKKRKTGKHSHDDLTLATPSGSPPIVQEASTTARLPANEPSHTPSQVRKTSKQPLQKKPPELVSEPQSRYRVYTSETRMWYALTGHGPDIKKIPPMQFACLSIIATRRYHGILQAELVRVSGQDKRSVPHRTDLLAENGYIEKRTVLSKRTKTSILYAKRFAPKTAFIPQVSIENQPNADEDRKQGTGIIDYLPVFDNILKLLKDSKMMTLVKIRKNLVIPHHENSSF